MNKNKYFLKFLNKKDISSYFKFFPYYLISSSLAFITDTSFYSFLRPKYGIIFAAVNAFLAGTTILFFMLRLTNKSKIKSKRKGFFFQVLIGLGSLCINIIALYFIDILIEVISQNKFQINTIYSFFTKIISGCFGFVWSSFLTSKYNFDYIRR